MCMIHLQNYIISWWKHLMMNTTIYQMQKEVKQTPNIIMLISHLINMTIKKYKEKKLLDLPPLEGDEEQVKEGKGLKIVSPNKLLTRFPIL